MTSQMTMCSLSQHSLPSKNGGGLQHEAGHCPTSDLSWEVAMVSVERNTIILFYCRTMSITVLEKDAELNRGNSVLSKNSKWIAIFQVNH